MRRIGALIVAAAWTLAGCTPGGEPTIPSATTEPAVTPPPAVTPTPTPQWTEEEQAAIDAVARYRETTERIAQDLDSADWNEIWDVASDAAATDLLELWSTWQQEGLHMVGFSEFTVDRVSPGMGDGQGKRYYVYGCQTAGDSYLADAQGSQAISHPVETAAGRYVVLHTNGGLYLVVSNTAQEAPCGSE